jgi:squalene-hopene/tetraprenyl-beta-curcumene cyclase
MCGEKTGEMKSTADSQFFVKQKKQIRSTGYKKISHTHREPAKRDVPGASLFTLEQLNRAVTKAQEHFLSIQNAKGYWVFDLEADATIPSEYIILHRFLDRKIEPGLKERLCRYLRRRQLPVGGWPLYNEDGAANISASVKAYFALKLSGDSENAPHMIKARQLILSLGGAASVNVFTRITLALFGQIPWRTTPAMPVEIMLLPGWFFFHVSKISYWSRTVLVPLLILCSKHPVCRLRPEETLAELFIDQPEKLCNIDHFIPGSWQKNIFILMDRVLKRICRFIPQSVHEKALKCAEGWTIERMQGKGGIGAIFPAMANAVMALKVLGYPDDDPDYMRGIRALDDLLLDRGDESLCQPCNSPIWDACLSLSAMLESGIPPEHKAVRACVDWLFAQQINIKSDWSLKAPDLEPGGWAFQFENTLYPDVDDTPMVIMALLRSGALSNKVHREKTARAVNWVLGMQSSDGGWGSFDIDNNYRYLNNIPFADHGALLDPSTSDLTGRCVELLSMLGYGRDFPPIARALDFLRKEQEEWGAWYGRWGVNYLYGTWSVLMGLKQSGEDMSQPYIRKAVAWLKSCQNPDRGWGETCYTYNDPSLAGKGSSTPSQTAWALLALMAAGEVNSPEVHGGICYLLSYQNDRGFWNENHFTGTGFPKVFYLRYHGYSQYFPLWALGLYRCFREGRKMRQDEVRLKCPADLPLQSFQR